MTDKDFEILFREQFDSLCNLAFTIVKNTEEAKDVVQQVFLNYWQRRSVIEIRGSVKGYFYKAVLNTALSRYPKVKQMIPLYSQLTDTLACQPEQEHYDNLQRDVHKAISELPPVCQKVFRLSRFSDLPNKEIAEELNISVKAVEKHITKAIKSLRKTLKPLVTSGYYTTLLIIIGIELFRNGVGFPIIILSLI